MSETFYPPFLHWGDYKSKDKKKPDIIKIKVTNLDTWEAEYSINLTALVDENGEWIEMNIPLKSHNSPNRTLLDLWTKAVNEKKIKIGDILVIKLYRDKSINNRPIKRFSLELL